MKKPLLILVMLCSTSIVWGQELQARITVTAAQISSNVDKKVFQTLQGALYNFLNNRKWTGDTYLTQERIKCNFLLNIERDLGQNTYGASLTVQAARPVYNSVYESPIINWQDNDLTFRYVEFQPVEFNENRVQGADPLAANLTAVIAYYINIILGMDADSFAPNSGEPFYRKAQNIVVNAPEGREITGWKTFDGIRNRFRLVDNLTDNRFNAIHEAMYAYYRQGLDVFYEDEDAARKGVLDGLVALDRVNQEVPNSMAMQFFFGGKSGELVRIFSRATPAMKTQARDLLSRLDITNTAAYKELR